MYAKLYNSLERYHTAEVLEAAKAGTILSMLQQFYLLVTYPGIEFILQHVKVSGEQRCYFMVSREGNPVKLQRKPFTECFYTMALAELARATGTNHYMASVTCKFGVYNAVSLKEAAEKMLGQLIQWIMVDSSSLGSGYLTRGTSELGRPMMLLNVLQEVCGNDTTKRKQYEKEISWSIQKIQTHLQV